MKKLIIFGIFFIMVSSLFAHPAEEVTAEYSHKTKLLKVRFDHYVTYGEEHYISKVQVEVNSKIVVTQFLSKQDNTGGGKLVFRLADLQKGDLVKVTSECSEYGKTETEVVIK